MPTTTAAERDLLSPKGRDKFAQWLAVATLVALAAILLSSAGLSVLMPGGLSSAHGGVRACSTCHTRTGDTKLSWLHGLLPADHKADSGACLKCHKMPETALNPHSAPVEVLKESTVRLTKLVMNTSSTGSEAVQSHIAPTQLGNLQAPPCATCHQEHQGTGFNLRKMSNEECGTCHVLKLKSFDKDHPDFNNYPFQTRTRIIFDHSGHFGKHYPEIAKKEPEKKIPQTCSTCHDGRADKRIMTVAPFEKTCATCHADQITGKDRISGPKGVAFLSLPGLDIGTLNKRKAALGEWPEDSDAALTPFMKVIIGRTDKGHELLTRLEGVNLQDLNAATDAQIQSVTDLVWEIKRLLYALISEKASDVLADLKIIEGATLTTSLVGDLTAGIPRDVLIGAQQQWLPNLSSEITRGPALSNAVVDDKAAPTVEPTASSATKSEPNEPESTETAAAQPAGEPERKDQRDPPACVLRLLGSCLVSKAQSNAQAGKDAAPPVADLPQAAPQAKSRLMPSDAFGAPMRAGLSDVPPPKQVVLAENAKTGDDLLFPTEDELRELKARNARSASEQPASSSSSGGSGPSAQPVITIDSGIDPESWADVGGWYRQDHTIFYRPTGHKDKFIASWLFLTGPKSPRQSTTAISAVFTALAGKDAPGTCTKCHSVDDIATKGRVVNFTPLSVASKAGRFTRFAHEPHLTISDDRGCLTCHTLSQDRSYLKSYEQGSTKVFKSNFAPVKREICQTCHTDGKARQDCQLCHSYHVNGVVTPPMQTKLPTQ